MAWDGSEYEVALNYLGPNSTIAVNVLGFQAQSGGPASPSEVADVLDDFITDVMMAQTTSEVTMLALKATRLQDGATATVPINVSPAEGGEVLPSLAVVLSYTTNFPGPSGHGRSYLPFLAEVAFIDGLVDATTVNAVAAGWVGFFQDAEAADLQHVVLSRGPELVHEVRAVTAHYTAGSQSRRQRRIFV